MEACARTLYSVHVWAYGDTMLQCGTEVSQVASVRIQLQGYRSIIAFRTSTIFEYMHLGQGVASVSLKAIKEFIEKLQPAEAAKLVKDKPSLSFGQACQGQALLS